MSDFQVLPFDFNSTTVCFRALTPRARDRIYGGISTEVFKSAAPMFLEQLEAEGFAVEVL